MPARLRVPAPVLTGVAALLLAGCSSAGAPSTAGATAPASPQPTSAATPSTVTPSAATPSAATPSTATPSAAPTMPTATKVIMWYGTGGADKLDNLINSVARVQAQHAAGSTVIDLGQSSKDLFAARQYSPIPDQDTQTAWSAAIQQLGSGMDDVLRVSILNPGPTLAPEQARATEARGWEEFGAGVAGLKDVDSRLQAFGCLPHGDPWKV
ncbi:hypothetical protein PUR71_16590 [Streptomyces sp. SP17BM10]|uniref:hypothetical protein n=1 Tax=Streptomyces sp. SP17BM10 TaxID=3002530 RepID=UPI002E7677EE|nr:hypothetical protein [Streptomyces sp. SP17BM10]MEE1784508.1 hypothetical protein [Streptomyces sp. SP17BM10]